MNGEFVIERDGKFGYQYWSGETWGDLENARRYRTRQGCDFAIRAGQARSEPEFDDAGYLTVTDINERSLERLQTRISDRLETLNAYLHRVARDRQKLTMLDRELRNMFAFANWES